MREVAPFAERGLGRFLPLRLLLVGLLLVRRLLIGLLQVGRLLVGLLRLLVGLLRLTRVHAGVGRILMGEITPLLRWSFGLGLHRLLVGRLPVRGLGRSPRVRRWIGG